jgi:hypothetical protein
MRREQGDGDHLVDDVAVLGQFTQPDGLPDVGRPDVPGPHLDNLVRDAQVGGQPPRVGQVLAGRGADGERHAVGVHLAHVQQGQGAVQPAGEDDPDGQAGVDAHPDAVLQGGPDQLGGLVGVLDLRLVVAEPEQVQVGVQDRSRRRVPVPGATPLASVSRRVTR